MSTPPAKRKRVPYTQKYINKWENDPKFAHWLTKSNKGPLYFHCKLCNSDGKAGKSELEKHAAGEKHKKIVESSKNTVSVLSMPSVSGEKVLEKKVKEAEIRLAAVVSELNLPFSATEKLVPAIQAICSDPDVVKKLKLGRTKCTGIVKNVLGNVKRDELLNLLRENVFSLMVDESTDRGCTKHLALVARVATSQGIKDAFLTLVPLESATADTLYECVKAVFNDANIPYKENMIGFAADGASVMMGANHSLSSLLKNDIPNLFIMNCICHSFHLCASYACKTLPRWVEDFTRNIYNYFLSPKQTAIFKDFQVFTNLKPHKLLHPCQTRWLSLHSAVARILEQLPALKLFFTQAAFEDRLLTTESILQKLNDPFTKLYLEFLDHCLPIFNDLNKEMQSEKPKIYSLHSRVSAVLRTILDCYMKPMYLESTPLSSIRIRDPANFLPLENVHLGGRVTVSLVQGCQDLDKKLLDTFRLRCLDFYIEAASQIMKRFNVSNPVFLNLKALDPQSVLKKTVPSVAPLVSLFSHLVPENEINEMDREWRLLRNTELDVQPDIDVYSFWDKVSNLNKGDDTPLFPLVANFMKKLLCLPHSSASVERVFSLVNLMKTKVRNSLNTETLNGMLHAKKTFEYSSAHTFQVTKSHLDLMNDNIYSN